MTIFLLKAFIRTGNYLYFTACLSHLSRAVNTEGAPDKECLGKRLEWRCTVFLYYFSAFKGNLSFSVLLAEYFKGRKFKGKKSYPRNYSLLFSSNLLAAFFFQFTRFFLLPMYSLLSSSSLLAAFLFPKILADLIS